MFGHRVADFEIAYQNGADIAGSSRWPEAWNTAAADYRTKMTQAERAELDISYGPHARHRLDLFLPEGKPKGLAVIVHGGYWLAFDKSTWSHLANGAVEQGYAVALPSYRLAPEAGIADIVADVGSAIATAAERVEGPVFLTGHSAGGHLVSRMVSEGTPLPTAVSSRIRHVVSLSGVHDLRPIMATDMNGDLKIDEATARAHSPALLRPLPGTCLTCWAGGAERAELRRQNALLANIWIGLGATTFAWEEPDRHHFDVIDDLADPASKLVATWLS